MYVPLSLYVWYSKQIEGSPERKESNAYKKIHCRFEIHIYLIIWTEPMWQSEYSRFFFFFIISKTRNENTVQYRQRTDSAVLSLPFHSACLYTQKDCTLLILHFHPSPVSFDIAKGMSLKQSFWNCDLQTSVTWHTLTNTHILTCTQILTNFFFYSSHTYSNNTKYWFALILNRERCAALIHSGLAHLSN